MNRTWPLGRVKVKSGMPSAAFDRGLLLVVDVLDEPGEPQHVLGHALAPLAAGLRAGERLAQRLGRVGERARHLAVGAQALLDPAELLCRPFAEGVTMDQPTELVTDLVADVFDVAAAGRRRRGRAAPGSGARRARAARRTASSRSPAASARAAGRPGQASATRRAHDGRRRRSARHRRRRIRAADQSWLHLRQGCVVVRDAVRPLDLSDPLSGVRRGRPARRCTSDAAEQSMLRPTATVVRPCLRTVRRRRHGRRIPCRLGRPARMHGTEVNARSSASRRNDGESPTVAQSPRTSRLTSFPGAAFSGTTTAFGCPSKEDHEL